MTFNWQTSSSTEEPSSRPQNVGSKYFTPNHFRRNNRVGPLYFGPDASRTKPEKAQARKVENELNETEIKSNAWSCACKCFSKSVRLTFGGNFNKLTNLSKICLVGCRGVVQLGGPDPWYTWIGPAQVGAHKLFLFTESSLVVKIKNTWLMLLLHYYLSNVQLCHVLAFTFTSTI